MLTQILQVIEGSSKLLDLMTQGKAALGNEEDRKKLETYLQSVVDDMQVVIDTFEQTSNIDKGKWSRLQKCSKEFYDYIKNIDPNDARATSEELKKIFNDPDLASSLNEETLQDLKKMVGNISELVKKIHVYQPRKKTNRRQGLQLLLWFTAGMSGVSAVASGFNLWNDKKNPQNITNTPSSTTTKTLPSVTWKLKSNFGESTDSSPILFEAPKRLKELIEEMSDRDFFIDVVSNNTTINRTDSVLTDVHEGKDIQCGFAGIYYDEDEKYYPLYFSCAIPFGLNPQEQTAWLLWKENEKDEKTYVQKLYEKLGLNIIPFPVAATGAQMGGWFDRKITDLDSLNGVTMRIPGLGKDVLKKLNSNFSYKHKIRFSQIKDSLINGDINAAEWIGPYDEITILELNKAKTKEGKPLFYHYPGWWEPSTTYDIQVNLDAWNRLSDKYRAIFKAACLQVYTEMLLEYEQKNSQVLYDFVLNDPTKIIPFPDAILKAAKSHTKTILIERAGRDPNFQEVYMRWNEFRTRIRKWSNTSLPYGMYLSEEAKKIIDSAF